MTKNESGVNAMVSLNSFRNLLPVTICLWDISDPLHLNSGPRFLSKNMATNQGKAPLATGSPWTTKSFVTTDLPHISAKGLFTRFDSTFGVSSTSLSASGNSIGWTLFGPDKTKRLSEKMAFVYWLFLRTCWIFGLQRRSNSLKSWSGCCLWSWCWCWWWWWSWFAYASYWRVSVCLLVRIQSRSEPFAQEWVSSKGFTGFGARW